jgi:hypothetical protein
VSPSADDGRIIARVLCESALAKFVGERVVLSWAGSFDDNVHVIRRTI